MGLTIFALSHSEDSKLQIKRGESPASQFDRINVVSLKQKLGKSIDQHLEVRQGEKGGGGAHMKKVKVFSGTHLLISRSRGSKEKVRTTEKGGETEPPAGGRASVRRGVDEAGKKNLSFLKSNVLLASQKRLGDSGEWRFPMFEEGASVLTSLPSDNSNADVGNARKIAGSEDGEGGNISRERKGGTKGP